MEGDYEAPIISDADIETAQAHGEANLLAHMGRSGQPFDAANPDHAQKLKDAAMEADPYAGSVVMQVVSRLHDDYGIGVDLSDSATSGAVFDALSIAKASW